MNKSINELPEILDAREISNYLGIGYQKSLHFIKYSGLPFLKLGNTYRVFKKIAGAILGIG
jgi:hypothetical protein